ncbi:HAMP domain-containing sensor histidine kinase [Clostridium sp. MD294]|uniref:sensor histidine kinase n=1 Tax=Clostridium sp. MD294 TaxID=97138 RepID=UPI000687CD14|nr:HAMP domain-containing sensor histidine kinase [Clostridium sp. MD294]
MTQNTFLQNGELVIILTKLKKKWNSLQCMLLLTYMLVGVVPLILFTNTIFRTMDEYFVEERKKELLNQANILSGKISASEYLYDTTKWNQFNEEIRMISNKGNFRVIVIDASGIVINDSSRQDIGKTYLVQEVIEALDNKDVSRQQEDGVIYATVSILDKNSNKIGVVLISALSDDVSDTVGEIRNQSNILFLMITIMLTILIYFSTRFFIEPLKKVLGVIIKMSEGHFDQRIDIRGIRHNEITDLALACNNMAERLEQVDTSRQNFVSNVSHELKTPLSSMKVLSESILLQKNVSKEVYIEFLEDITSEIDRMTEIINDLLTLVKLDQKEIPITFIETELNQLVLDVIKRMKPLADEKKIALNYTLLKEKVLAEVDKTKFMLAISNLVENAIKYTSEKGLITITIDSDYQNVFLSVSDTGIGIAEEEISKIFERFYRVDKTRNRETGGTGLGLSITHATILMHNGSIKVSSKEQEGTTFLVCIPIKQTI